MNKPRWPKEVAEQAKREKKAMVRVIVDKRFCDPPGGAIMIEGAVTNSERIAAIKMVENLAKGPETGKEKGHEDLPLPGDSADAGDGGRSKGGPG